jgi:hypothetical protein
MAYSVFLSVAVGMYWCLFVLAIVTNLSQSLGPTHHNGDMIHQLMPP